MRLSSFRRQILWAVALIILAAGFRFCIARFFPNDNPEDGRVYARMARNLLEHHVYSRADKPPYEPTLIRLPGYSIFLACIYSVFGHDNNTAVRITQVLIDTASCVLVALLAFYWEPDERRKRAAALIALALAALCPFTTIYVATILTEVPTIFFALALCLLTTFAFRASTFQRSLWWWGATGLLAGIAVFFRPDSGLFAAAIGLTLVITWLPGRRTDSQESRLKILWRRAPAVLAQGAVLSVAFILVLFPWTIRNWRVFHLFQPLAPTHAEMPGEFVARGYQAWLRTWVDDQRYISPVIWSQGDSRITLDDIPDSAFDSPEEKARVGNLLHRYNHPPEVAAQTPSETAPKKSQPQASNDRANKTTATPTPQASPSPQADEQGGDQADQPQEGENDEEDDQNSEDNAHQPVEMTPEIDAGLPRLLANGSRARRYAATFGCLSNAPAPSGSILIRNIIHSKENSFPGVIWITQRTNSTGCRCLLD